MGGGRLDATGCFIGSRLRSFGDGPGWTAHGHGGDWGYGWYRLTVQVTAAPGKDLAIEGPPGVDDGYQVYQNGKLVGSFGDFSSRRPVVYNTQPVRFDLPKQDNTGS